MKKPRKIELLAPARTAEIAREAIFCGADAVYLGPPQFGARSAAGNSVDDIAELCDFAHIYGAKVYVTINTILRDEELAEAEKLIRQLYAVHTDAIIVQDMGLLRLDLPPIALHASTQIDTRTPEKARFLSDVGFSQIVLARELPIEQIASIHDATDTPLEAFVHGALCVSYSGQCYASAYLFNRSANRGECAQFCRLAFDLKASDGTMICHDKHLLSLRDMNRSKDLESMLDAGVSSFKIEGRLKDINYVKNVTAFYRQQLDTILERRKEDFERASYGTCNIPFSPQLNKSFNRGFTNYFLHGRKEDCSQPDTPKSLGEPVGEVKDIRGRVITVAGIASFHNGDGICFFDERRKLQGFRVNRVDGNKLYLAQTPIGIAKHTQLFRNQDQAFEQQLAHTHAERKLKVDIRMEETPNGFLLTITDERNISENLSVKMEKEIARTPQAANIERQFSKLGESPFVLQSFKYDCTSEYFIPSSVLGKWRRELTELLLRKIREAMKPVPSKREELPTIWAEKHLSYLANVSNSKARLFWKEHGVETIEDAFENARPPKPTLMFCRHCIRYALGYCPTLHHRRAPWPEPWTLSLSDGHRFTLEFDCKNCQMKIHAPR